MTSYMRNSRDSRNFGMSQITGSGPLSPRSSVAVTFQERYNTARRISGLSEYSSKNHALLFVYIERAVGERD